jgi:type IV secretory pathway VirB10-like protein
LEWTSQQKNAEYSLGKKVHQIDSETNAIIKTHTSIRAAVTCLNEGRTKKEKINKTGISRCCHGEIDQYTGYIWKFSDKPAPKALDVEDLDAIKPEADKPDTKKTSPKKKPVKLTKKAPQKPATKTLTKKKPAKTKKPAKKPATKRPSTKRPSTKRPSTKHPRIRLIY